MLIHCDLGCEHIFCDPLRGVLTGVIDWATQRSVILRYGPFSELLYGAYSGSEKFIAQGIEGLHAMFRVL